MLTIALIMAGAALGAFVIYYTLVAYELRHGNRVVLVGVRTKLDHVFVSLQQQLSTLTLLPSRATIRAEEVAARARQRQLSRSNRRVTAIDVPHHSKSTSHLATLRQHRLDTALSPEEARKLRNLKLEERF